MGTREIIELQEQRKAEDMERKEREEESKKKAEKRNERIFQTLLAVSCALLGAVAGWILLMMHG